MLDTTNCGVKDAAFSWILKDTVAGKRQRKKKRTMTAIGMMTSRLKINQAAAIGIEVSAFNDNDQLLNGSQRSYKTDYV